MMEIVQNRLLRILYEQETISLYSWHQETCLSPISIAHAVLSLREKGVLQLNDNHKVASLTDYGRKWIEGHFKELFTSKSEEPWKQVPKGMANEGNVSFQSFFEQSDIQKLLDSSKTGGR